MARVVRRRAAVAPAAPAGPVVYRMAVTPIKIDKDGEDTYQLEAFNFEHGSRVVGRIIMDRDTGNIAFYPERKA
jgi:hypothetical protein